ncbi:MAG: erythromycin esterase family protein [Halobacteriaceae archaeon]
MADIEPRGSFTRREVEGAAVDEVREYARPVDGPRDVDDLLDTLSAADCVLLGEASHGTSEFYRWRARLTAELIEHHGFDFVAVEGDWTSCYEVNRFVKGADDTPPNARETLDTFERWPTWMWANWETVGLLDWLETYNRELDADERAGFYGLDVYSLHESMSAVVDYLDRTNPAAAQKAREAYRCFEPYGEDAQEYARATRMVPEDCEEEVIEVLEDLRRSAPEYGGGPDARFNAEQNALVARNAEEYYRTMMTGRGDSWNVRDEHMAETLKRLLDHHGEDSTAVVWAHNTHVGDARATDMPQQGRLNLGQLVREQDAVGDTAVVGFGTHSGKVVAGDEWGAPMANVRVPEARDGSYEDVFHRAEAEDRLLFTDDVPDDAALAAPRGHRAIGVVYRPALESGNYVPTALPDRYDAFVHLDRTTSLHPLELHPEGERVPDLYPSGL